MWQQSGIMVQQKQEMVRKRVLYIGSAVPLDTAEGLDGVQQPLSERYPVDDDNKIEGILSFVAVTPAGLTLQYVSDPANVILFPITSLSLCAAVRCVTTVNATTGEKTARFVSLSSPAAGGANSKRPAIFTTITRRTEGRKVLECHGFVCSSSSDALELVQHTSFADRLSKGKVNGAPVPSAGPGSSVVDGAPPTPRSLDTSMVRAASAAGAGAGAGAGAEADHPVRLVAGDNFSQRVAPEFYEPPPTHGYFYKTRDSQIKTYAVERVMDGEAERLRAISPHTVPTLSRGPPSERRSVHGGSGVALAGPGVGYGAGGMTLPYPAGRTLIPVRAVPPPPSTLGRPRFFSPPPPLLRPRPGPPGSHVMARGDPVVFLPPPPGMVDASFLSGAGPGPGRRRASSDSSSHRSSGSSSPPASPRDLPGKTAVNGEGGPAGGDGSSDVSSRPRTPPTDYEKGGPRVSRKEQFHRHQRHLREVNGAGPLPAPVFGYATLPGPGGAPPPHAVPVHPYDFYMYPRYPYPGLPPYMLERARSVPPSAARAKSKESKKSARKAKKEKKKKSGKKRTYGVPSDISTDSVGYASELGPGAGAGEYPRMPRDFRRLENQFKHERAFSKSLAQEFRAEPGENAGNAYALNEHMLIRAAAAAEPEFNMY